MKYGVDCERVFGYFLHHFPYVGLRGEADLEAHHRMGERMKELYEETFGDDYLHAATAWSASPARARRHGPPPHARALQRPGPLRPAN